MFCLGGKVGSTKRRRGYLKHYNDAMSGGSLRVLAARREYMAICLFWYVLEQCNQQNSDKIEIDKQTLRLHFNCKTASLLNSCEACCAAIAAVSFNETETKLEFQIANYAEYQETRGQKTSKKGAKDAPIKDKRLKIKDKRLNIHETSRADALGFHNQLVINQEEKKNKKQEWFNQFWSRYPNKSNKQKARKSFLDQIATEADWCEIQRALEIYLKDQKANLWRKPKLPTTFLGSKANPHWRDFLEPDFQIGEGAVHRVVGWENVGVGGE